MVCVIIVYIYIYIFVTTEPYKLFVNLHVYQALSGS